jgi:hypothetical protein
MAGVIAQNRAIVRSTNARVLVNLISVLLPLTTRNKDNACNYDANPPLTTTAVTVITALKLTKTITLLG